MAFDNCDSRRARGLFTPHCQRTPIKESVENIRSFGNWLTGKIRDWDGGANDRQIINFKLDMECVVTILQELDPSFEEKNQEYFNYLSLNIQQAVLTPEERAYHELLKQGKTFRKRNHRETNALENAMKKYNEAIVFCPDNPDGYYFRGFTLFELTWYTSAIKSFEKCNDLTLQKYGVNDAYAIFMLGNTYLNLKEHENALQQFTLATEINPLYFEAWTNKGILHDYFNQSTDAIHACSCALDLEPDIPIALIVKGHSYNKLKLPKEAFDCYNKATVLDPKNAEAWLFRASALSQINRVAEAWNNLKRALTLLPELAKQEYFSSCWDANVCHLIGKELYSRGQWSDSVSALSRSLFLNPAIPNSWYYLGCAFFFQQNYHGVVEAFEHYLKSDPDNAVALILKGMSHKSLKEHNLALEEFDQLLSFSPNNLEIILMKADSLFSLKRAEEAIQFCDLCLSIDSGYKNAENKKQLFLRQIQT